jgi:hypothetical protein
MPWKNFDYTHYIQNHPLQDGQLLHPLFEAIQNAFQSIDAEPPAKPTIRIVLNRDTSQATIPFPVDGSRIGTAPDIVSIEVIDNGEGFTKLNWGAFETISTSNKKKLGGKGMGRLSYCIPFGKVEFDSTWRDGANLKQRTFTLSHTKHGTSVAKESDARPGSEQHTKVLFLKPIAKFKKKFPKTPDALAKKIVKHFFTRFSVSDVVQVLVEDTWKKETIDVGQLCQSEFILERRSVEIRVQKRNYTLTHVRVKSSAAKRHEVLMCAQGRLVHGQDIGASLMVQKRPVSHDSGVFFYAGILEGDVLEKSLRDDRLSFNLPQYHEVEDLEYEPDGDCPSLDELSNAVARSAEEFLRSYLAPIKDSHIDRVREFCKRNPVFRPVLSACVDDLMRISPYVSDDQLAEEIGKVYYRWKAEAKARFERLTKTGVLNDKDLKAHREKHREALRQMADMAFYDLAQYVVDRKAVIDFLWNRMAADAEGKLKDEDAIHDVFFPRKLSSGDVDWDESNLWLVDERLIHQFYVASDIEWKKHAPINANSNDRPDVAVYHDQAFNGMVAFAEGGISKTAVTLIEFKKPERKHYTNDENPIEQAFRYITEIRSAKARTDDQHRFHAPMEAPIHVFVICHIVEELMPYIDRTSCIPSTDGEGFIIHVPRQNAIIQVMSFEKLIEDAQMRNQAFFRKLGIS